jgi:hypothetical protein
MYLLPDQLMSLALTVSLARHRLQKRVAELEEVNAWLKASNAEMQLTVTHSGEAITLLQHQLDEELENHELLDSGMLACLMSLMPEDLESELAVVKTKAVVDAATLEARLVAAEARVAESFSHY